jgi:acyl-CoA thioester hydrolase
MSPFELALVPVESDVDTLGHVNNVTFVRWIQDVAVAHSTSVGMDMAAYQKLGAIFVVRRHEVDYLRPVMLGEKLVARTWVAEASGAKCLRMTELVRESDAEKVAVGRTTWAFIQFASGRPQRIPAELFTAFGAESLA